MRTLTVEGRRVEFLDAGTGAPVLLLHSSASGAGQWQALVRELSPSRRVVAPNLIGYGRSEQLRDGHWPTLGEQASLALAALGEDAGTVDLVGHSYGALVALEAARALGDRAGRIVLFEPNAFALLRAPGHEAAFAEVAALHAHVRACAARGDWPGLAARFADFFSGDGTWDGMPEERRSALATALAPNPGEWEAAMAPDLDPAQWREAGRRVLLVWARDTRLPLLAIARLCLAACPDWEGLELPRGGHMAPLRRPRDFNAAVLRFLDPRDTGTATRNSA